MLEHLGASVHAVSSGEQALAEFALSDWDLVLLDCQMPGIDGFETSRRLRSRGVTTPILALTAGVTEEEQRRCHASGMDAVIAKPVTLAHLREAVQKWAPAREAVRPSA